MDNPEKYQYKPSEIIAHGGADIRKYLTATGGDKIKNTCRNARLD